MADKIGNLGMACAALTLIAQTIRVILEMFQFLPCGC